MLLPYFIYSFASFVVRGKVEIYYRNNYLFKGSLHLPLRMIYSGLQKISWGLVSCATSLYWTGTRVAVTALDSRITSSSSLHTVLYPISSLCASLNENTLPGVTFFIFIVLLLFKAHIAVIMPCLIVCYAVRGKCSYLQNTLGIYQVPRHIFVEFQVCLAF